MTESSTSTSGDGIASAVTPNVYFNGSLYTGPAVDLAVIPGSHATMLVNVSYPWNNVQPAAAQGSCLEFSFTVGPFPASLNVSTVPGWMHVSLSPPSLAIPYEATGSVSLLVSVDDTAPSASGASL